MKIYVTATYGRTIEVPDNADEDEVELIAQDALNSLTSDDQTDWDWEYVDD